MPASRVRTFSIAALLATALALVLSAGANAAVSASEVTTPSDPTYAFEDEAAKTGELIVEGNATGEGEVSLVCYYGSASVTVEEGIEVEGGKFKAEVPVSELPEAPCVLRAVPDGDASDYPPGSASAFKGPRIAPSVWRLETNGSSKATFGYELRSATFAASFLLTSAGECGLEYSAVFPAPSFAEGERLFSCGGALYQRERVPLGDTSSRSDIQVDGHNAYTPFAANELFNQLKTAVPPAATVSRSFDPATGLATVEETDPIVICTGKEAAFPETANSCEAFASSGVELHRVWRTSAEGKLVYMTDEWRSTNGAAHTVSALYSQELLEHAGTPGALEVPGRAGFAPTHAGESIPVAAGPGTIAYEEDGAAPEAGDLVHPFAAIAYDRSPAGPLGVFYGSAEEEEWGFDMPYSFSVPASGAQTLRMAYAQSLDLPEARSLAAAALASFAPPVATSSPTAGATTAPRVVVAIGSRPSPPDTIKLGNVKAAKGLVFFTIGCKGPAGTSCNVQALLHTVELLRKGKISALSARTKKRTVTVASYKATIAVGRHTTAVLRLDATGRKLLARFHRLPAQLLVLLFAPSGTHTTALAKNLVVTPPPKPKRRR